MAGISSHRLHSVALLADRFGWTRYPGRRLSNRNLGHERLDRIARVHKRAICGSRENVLIGVLTLTVLVVIAGKI